MPRPVHPKRTEARETDMGMGRWLPGKGLPRKHRGPGLILNTHIEARPGDACLYSSCWISRDRRVPGAGWVIPRPQ